MKLFFLFCWIRIRVHWYKICHRFFWLIFDHPDLISWIIILFPPWSDRFVRSIGFRRLTLQVCGNFRRFWFELVLYLWALGCSILFLSIFEHRRHKILIRRAFYSPRPGDFKTVFFSETYISRIFWLQVQVWDPLKWSFNNVFFYLILKMYYIYVLNLGMIGKKIIHICESGNIQLYKFLLFVCSIPTCWEEWIQIQYQVATHCRSYHTVYPTVYVVWFSINILQSSEAKNNK